MELLLAVIIVEAVTGGAVTAALGYGVKGAFTHLAATRPARRKALDARRRKTRWGRLVIRVRDGLGAAVKAWLTGAVKGAGEGLAVAKARRRRARQAIAARLRGWWFTDDPAQPDGPPLDPGPDAPFPGAGPGPADSDTRPDGTVPGRPPLTLVPPNPEAPMTHPTSTGPAGPAVTDANSVPAAIAAWQAIADAATYQAEQDEAHGFDIPGLHDLLEHLTGYVAGLRSEFGASVEGAEGTRAAALAPLRQQ